MCAINNTGSGQYNQNLNNKIQQMNLLSNLLEFSHYQPTSLMFCESPKDVSLDRNTKELRNMMSARKEETVTPEKRTVSKSLSKLDLLSLSNTKIDPKQRLLHRMVHKLSMKCRKHYYNFFVVLENLKKKNVSATPQKKIIKLDNSNIQIGLVKILQLEQLLFSKYFSNSLKKSSFQAIAKWARLKTAFGKLFKIFNKKSTHDSFQAILQYSKKMEKQEIRMDILIDSIHHIDRSITYFRRTQYLQTFIGKLKANLVKYKESSKKKIEQEYKTPLKSKAEPEVKNTQPFSAAHSPFSKEKTSSLTNSVQQSYLNLKTRKRIDEDSPGKPKQPILIACQQVKLKIQKCYNYIKNNKCKTNLHEQTLAAYFGKQPDYQISKRCEPVALSSHQVPDLNDKSSIFFDQIFSNIQANRREIAQSTVKILHKKDSISQTFSQELHSTSQLTLIAPLSQKFYEQPKRTISSSGVKGSAFGSEAVNFKNSLVIERQLMKEQEEERGGRERKELNFAKNKNSGKNQKRIIYDEIHQIQARFKGQGRCESAQREYGSLKFRRQSDFTITIPQGVPQSANTTSRQVPFIKRNSETPQPDISRPNYGTERKHLSLMNNNKVQMLQDDGKRSVGATYLKILSKK